MLIPLWFRRRLVFAPEFFSDGRVAFRLFLLAGAVPIFRQNCSGGRSAGRADAAISVPHDRPCVSAPGKYAGGGFTGSSLFRIPDLYGAPPLRVVRFFGRRDFLRCGLRKLYFEGCGDAESVVKIKSEKTHGSFPISLYDCSQSAGRIFSRIIRESAPSPTAWADRDGSARLHRCPACGSSR